MNRVIPLYVTIVFLMIAAVTASADETLTASHRVSYVTMFSDGEWVGQGQMRYYVNSSDSVTVSGTTADFYVNVSGGPFGDSFTLHFAPPSGQKLHPGYYPNAQRTPFREYGHPGIDIYGDGRGCNEVGGRFDVTNLRVDASGAIKQLRMTFEQHCENGDSALFGEVRIGLPASGSGLTVVPDQIWWPDVPKGSAGSVVPVTFIPDGQDPVTVKKTYVSGANEGDYVIRSDECTGQTFFPGEGCQVWLRFIPKVAGPRLAQLHLTTSSGLRYSASLDGFMMGGLTRLVMNSDAGDYIGQGQSYSYMPANADISVGGNRTYFGGSVWPDDGTWWYLDFVPGSGDILAAGSTYNAVRYPFNNSGPGMDISGDGRGCNTLTGTFTVKSIAFELDGTVRNASISFVQHCDGETPALRGTIDFLTPKGDVTPPAPVTNLSAVRSADGLHANLTWKNPGAADFNGVIVRYLNAAYAPGLPNGSLVAAGTGKEATSVSIKVPAKQAFTAAVYAVDTSGNVSRPAIASFGP